MIKFFDEITEAELEHAGGKAASLVQLVQHGMPVPEGFVIFEEQAGKEGLAEVDAAFKKLNVPYVAVRSSANREDGVKDSFAGQFETFLFVNEKTLHEKIKECFASLNSERIKNYCESKNIDHEQLHLSVIVQKMVDSEVAGVCFTEHPVLKGQNKMIIEAAYGLGEILVSGAVTPDAYVIDKTEPGEGNGVEKDLQTQAHSLQLDPKNAGTQRQPVPIEKQSLQKLTDAQIQEVGEHCRKIETHYDKPMDIEWAYEKGQLYILQARPITT